MSCPANRLVYLGPLPSDIVVHIIRILAHDADWKSIMSLLLVNQGLYSIFNRPERLRNIPITINEIQGDLERLSRVLMANYLAESATSALLTQAHQNHNGDNLLAEFSGPRTHFFREYHLNKLTHKSLKLRAISGDYCCMSFKIAFYSILILLSIGLYYLTDPLELFDTNIPCLSYEREKRRVEYFKNELLPLGFLMIITSGILGFLLVESGCKYPTRVYDEPAADIEVTLNNEKTIRDSKLLNGKIDLTRATSPRKISLFFESADKVNAKVAPTVAGNTIESSLG